MKKDYGVTVGIRFPSKMYEDLQKASEGSRILKSEIVRIAVDKYLQTEMNQYLTKDEE